MKIKSAPAKYRAGCAISPVSLATKRGAEKAFESVAKRLLKSGLSFEETAKHTQLSIDHVRKQVKDKTITNSVSLI